MTIKLLSNWGAQPAGTLYTTDATTEAAMVAAKVATSNLAGGVTWVPPGNSPGLGPPAHFSPDGRSLVDVDGNELVRFADPGADKLRVPVQHLESTAAMSTTITTRMSPTGTYRTARVSWVNNGANGSAKLNIAANCDNDVAGLVASQSALQRDVQMAMGAALLLISPIPITSLNFSSDVAIAADAHRLVVSFGA